MKAKSMKRLLSVVMALTLLFSLAVPVYADDQNTGTADSAVTFEKVDNSEVSANLLKDRAVSTEDTEMPDYGDSEIVRVSIILEGKSTIAAGYSTVDIANNAAAMAYRDTLENTQESVTSAIEAVIGGDLDVVWNLTLAANIISANVAYGQIEQILAVDGVADVVIETEYKPAVVNTDLPDDPQMSTSSSQIGNTVAYQEGYTGVGSRIAIIDTGIDSDHLSFDAGAYEYSLKQLAEKAGMDYNAYVSSLNLLTAEEIASKLDKLNIKDNKDMSADALYQTSKNPFGYNYVDEDFDITHDHDGEGEHGSHVTGIAAANSYVPVEGGYAPALEAVKTQGVAPDAQILTMKVFGKNGGAYDSDYMVAIEDAIVLGCDSINLSLGSSNPGMTYSAEEEYQDIMNALVESDTTVTISAGNASYWSANANNLTGYLYDDGVSQDTVGSPGSYTNSLSVASVDNDGTTGTYINVGDSSIFYTETTGYGNAAMTTAAGEQEYVMIDEKSAGKEADYFGKLADVLEGKVAVCYRGSSSFFEKANAGAGNGAIATIVCNNQPGTISMNLDGYKYSAPCVSITQADAKILFENATEPKELNGITYYTGKMSISADVKNVAFHSEYYTMSDFSSWGVPGSLTMKPEITAPGGNIYSVNGAVAGGTSYENMSGTSMAAPQVAGMSALVAQYIKENKLNEKTGLTVRALTQSLLMSTASPLYEEANDGQYYSILNQGAGLANVGDAVSATSYIMMNADATESYADGKVKAELGDDVEKNGTYNFSFTINSLNDKDETYELSADLFTQALVSYYVNAKGDMGNYLDLKTTPLACSASWTVDGKALKSDKNLDGLDFNDDGLVNAEDGQALLDYVTGARAKIARKNKADLDDNGKIESYDAYLFFKALNTSYAVVPAGKSVTVSVTLTLTDAQKEYLNANYPTGAYIEGFATAKALDSDEGVQGTSHSIPILGYYGSWTDPSMYDLTTYTEYLDATYAQEPLRYSYLGTRFANFMTVKYAGDSGEYYFGGNPFFYEKYDENKNAFNSESGDAFAKAYMALIRNAANGRLTITNLATGKVEHEVTTGSKNSAFYYTNGGTWQYTSSNCEVGDWKAAGKEGDQYEITLTMAPEYYLNDDNSVDWDALGDGASLSMKFTLDNTAPEVTGVNGDILHLNDTGALTIEAKDNKNIAAVLLFDPDDTSEEVWAAPGSAAKDGKFTIEAELENKVYLLQVYDYANNCSTYRIFLNTEETKEVESITIRENLTVVKDNTAALSATVLPITLTDTGVTWSSDNESIATVNDNGIVTGVSAGTCTITAASKQDPTKTASCVVTVKEYNVTLYGALQDKEGEPLLFTWNLEKEDTWTKYAALNNDISSITLDIVDSEAPLYQQNTSGFMYKLNPETGEILEQSTATNAFGAPMWDMDGSFYRYATTGDMLTWAVFENFLLYSDTPMANTFNYGYDMTPFFAQLGNGASKLVSITWGGIAETDDGVICDVMFALDNKGYVWNLWVDSTTGDLADLGVVPTNLVSKYGLSFPTNGDSQFCSMVFDNDLKDLYLAYYTGNTTEIYVLYFIPGSGFEAACLGNVGDGVWPTALYMVTDNYSKATTADVNAVNPVAGTIETQDVTVAPEEITIPEITGSLNSTVTTGTERPAQLAAVEGEEISSNGNTVTLNVTENAISTNGVVTVKYDTEVLKLKEAKINGNYTSQVDDPENGTFTLGYVSLDGLTDVATLTFESLECDTMTGITVDHKEAGQSYGKAEDLDVTTGHNYGEPEFSWDDDHNCTATFTCTDCGDEVTMECDVTTETIESTCNAEGAIIYTATVTLDGKTYTDTVTVATSANGHNYGEPEFSWDKDFNCTATFTCTEGDDTQVVKCDVTYTDKDGIRTYTATVTFNGKTYTTTTTEKIADKDSGVKTGDNAPIFSLCIALIISLGCCLFVAFRMRRRGRRS